MSASLVARGPSNVRMRFRPGLVGPQGTLPLDGNGYIPSPLLGLVAGGGSVSRLLSDHLRSSRNALDFGALPTATGLGSTADSTAYLQSYIDAQALSGGVCRLPEGGFKTSAPLVIPVSDDASQARVTLECAGPGGTRIFSNHAGAAIRWAGGNGSNSHIGRAHVKGVSLIGPVGFAGSVGFDVVSAAYLKLEDLYAVGFETGLTTTAIECVTFDNVRLISNKRGWKHTHTSGTTGCNNVILMNSSITANTEWGAWLSVGSCLSIFNSDIQYNGPGSSLANTSWGLRLSNFGVTNGIGANISAGSWFEGNGGIADLWFENTVGPALAVHNVDGSGFFRLHYTGDPESERYTKHNILVTGDQPTRVFCRGSGFTSFNTYVPSAARPVWQNENSHSLSGIYDLGGSNAFSSTVDKPAVVEGAPIGSFRKFVVGGLTEPPAEGLVSSIKVGGDAVQHLGDATYNVGGIRSLSRNLAGTVAIPREYDASLHDFAGRMLMRNELNLVPMSAPAAPASGHVLYSDTADGGLKVKSAAGTVTKLDGGFTAYTPTLSSSGGGTGMTHTTVAKYKELPGGVVVVQGQSTFTSAGTHSGALLISLPFALKSGVGGAGSVQNTNSGTSAYAAAAGSNLNTAIPGAGTLLFWSVTYERA